MNKELGLKCLILMDVDFSAPEQAGQKIASKLKGETLHGLAYAIGSITLKPLRGLQAKGGWVGPQKRLSTVSCLMVRPQAASVLTTKNNGLHWTAPLSTPKRCGKQQATHFGGTVVRPLSLTYVALI
jgi:hypothetical protein